jgi:CubicO group peptidase (beta-lactamase class C family)
VPFQAVIDLAQRRGGAHSLLALRGGRIVAEHRRGCGPRSLFYCFSVTKPITAMAVHLLAERGLLELDQPVARYWPEYGSGGKAAITIRHVLAHRAGVPASLGHPSLDLLAMANWQLSVSAAARARVRWRPGEIPAYHVVSFGFILGEVVRRVSGQPISSFVAREFFEPLKMDAYFALPAQEYVRTVPVRGHGANWASPLYLNHAGRRSALVPAASLNTTAASLARFYQMLLNGGRTPTGRRILSVDSISAALAVTTDGEIDRTLNQRQRYGAGFQLGGLPGVVRGIGTKSPASAFGHNGSGVCTAWAEPVTDSIFIYLSNTADMIRPGLRFASALSDAAWSAFARIPSNCL